MLPIYRPSKLDNCIYFDLNMICNRFSLNLFSDASMKSKGPGKSAFCHGSIAVYGDNIIDRDFQVISGSTNSCAELRGIRSSLFLALRHRHEFPEINIFSDSSYSIQSIRDYIYDWQWNQKEENFHYNKFHSKHNKPIANQELIYECYCLLTELMKTNHVNLFHQRGHIKTVEDMNEAIKCFKRINGYYGDISLNLMRYISFFNNYIDEETRNIVYKTDYTNKIYRDALIFKPTPNSYLIGQTSIQ